MEDIYIGRRKNLIPKLFHTASGFILIAVILILFFIGIHQISKSNIDHQEDSLVQAVKRDIVQCYSMEGIYPPSLEYLEEHYGLIYDKDLFFVDYRPIASNIYPDVTIMRLDDIAEDGDE